MIQRNGPQPARGSLPGKRLRKIRQETTRAGRAAISSYVRMSPQWRAFAAKLGLSHGQQCKAAGELFFRVESAAVMRRRSWDIGRVIRDLAWTLGCHVPVPLADGALELAFGQVSSLNQQRAALLGC